MSEYVEWQPEHSAVKVRLHRRVLAGLEQEGADEFRGILLGTASPAEREVVVEDYDRLDPSADSAPIEEWFAGWNRHSLPAVGYFRAGAGDQLQMSDHDRDVFASHFPDALNILLLFQLRNGKARLLQVPAPPAGMLRDREPARPAGEPAAADRLPFRDPFVGAALPSARPRSTTRRYVGQAAAVGAGFLIGIIAFLALRGERPRQLPTTPPAAVTGTTPPTATAPVPPPTAPPAVAEKQSPFEADRSLDPKAGGAVNRAEMQQQIRGVLARWSESLVNGDVETHVNLYASSVSPCFGKSRMSRKEIREDLGRTLDRFGRMKVYKISDITITPVDANRAFATFRKRWETAGNRFAGEEREQLKLTRQGDNWLIASEQELKVYWSHKR